ncbi:MAG: hypothetical protein HY554_11855 [Elusimicrobia bacterium]|nr:hypothetical protein [Elusimicrobiota bacterium]
MDILTRLRLLLWLLILTLAGTILRQYAGGSADARPRLQWVPPAYGGAASRFAPRHEGPPLPDWGASVPLGFSLVQTPHFTIYAEGPPPARELLDALEKLHANLLIDLASFAPWAREERVSIFLLRREAAYLRWTGRPASTNGVSSIARRRIYVYESRELLGVVAHELGHVLFESFLGGASGERRWLREGLATWAQVERGLASPAWLPEKLDVLRRGGGWTLEDLARVEDLAGGGDDELRLWHAQSYSLVRFLIRLRFASSFYHFCRHLKAGLPEEEALVRAYGMPFNRLSALQHAWRQSLRSGGEKPGSPERRLPLASASPSPPAARRLPEPRKPEGERQKAGARRPPFSQYYFLLACLGVALTAMGLRLLADRRWAREDDAPEPARPPAARRPSEPGPPLRREDPLPICPACRARALRITEAVSRSGALSREQFARLVRAADRCPRHRGR